MSASVDIINTSDYTSHSSHTRYKYLTEIQCMMFTFGEVRYSSHATLHLVEDILHDQAVEWITQATKIASTRGSRFIQSEDLMFLIRKESSRLNRLKEFSGWKEIRKNAKAEQSVAEDFDDELDQSTIMERDAPKKKRKRYSWEFPYCLLSSNEEELIETDDSIWNSYMDSDSEKEFEEESNMRLLEADQLTKNMSKEEYMEFSECRQASFTYKKTRKFKEWLGFTTEHMGKPSDEVLEILGFLLWEGLRRLILKALEIKRQGSNSSEQSIHQINQKGNAKNDDEERRESIGLFISPIEPSPLQPKHIQQAFLALQYPQKQPWYSTKFSMDYSNLMLNKTIKLL